MRNVEFQEDVWEAVEPISWRGWTRNVEFQEQREAGILPQYCCGQAISYPMTPLAPILAQKRTEVAALRSRAAK